MIGKRNDAVPPGGASTSGEDGSPEPDTTPSESTPAAAKAPAAAPAPATAAGAAHLDAVMQRSRAGSALNTGVWGAIRRYRGENASILAANRAQQRRNGKAASAANAAGSDPSSPAQRRYRRKP